jgi:hypothetical protein
LTNSNESFAIFRKFGQLSSRILLQRQIELTELEKDLNELDAADAADPNRLYRLRGAHHKDGWDTAQRDLLSQVAVKLGEYGDF